MADPRPLEEQAADANAQVTEMLDTFKAINGDQLYHLARAGIYLSLACEIFAQHVGRTLDQGCCSTAIDHICEATLEMQRSVGLTKDQGDDVLKMVEVAIKKLVIKD